jgi:hypothetical protein
LDELKKKEARDETFSKERDSLLRLLTDHELLYQSNMLNQSDSLNGGSGTSANKRKGKRSFFRDSELDSGSLRLRRKEKELEGETFFLLVIYPF